MKPLGTILLIVFLTALCGATIPVAVMVAKAGDLTVGGAIFAIIVFGFLALTVFFLVRNHLAIWKK